MFDGCRCRMWAMCGRFAWAHSTQLQWCQHLYFISLSSSLPALYTLNVSIMDTLHGWMIIKWFYLFIYFQTTNRQDKLYSHLISENQSANLPHRSGQSGNWFSLSLMGLMHTMWRVYPTLPHCLINHIDIIWIGTKKANEFIIAVGFLKSSRGKRCILTAPSAPWMCHDSNHSCCNRTEVRRVARRSCKVSFF